MQTVGPRLWDIAAEIAAVNQLGGKPTGTIRITAIDHAVDTVLRPLLTQITAQHPDLRIKSSSDYRVAGLVAERFHIGVRWGDQVAKDMIAVRLAPVQCTVIVGAPPYFEAHGGSTTPQERLQHNGITLRLPSRCSPKTCVPKLVALPDCCKALTELALTPAGGSLEQSRRFLADDAEQFGQGRAGQRHHGRVACSTLRVGRHDNSRSLSCAASSRPRRAA